jgi:hypothetical protein
MTGIGADDKNGLWIIINLLHELPVLKVALFVEEDQIVGIFTENAGGLIFLQNDLILVDKHLKRRIVGDIKGLSYAFGNDDAAQVVDLSDDTD